MAHTHNSFFPESVTRRLVLSLGITLLFVVVEIITGIIANSLALITDAAHNFTDVLALLLTLWAQWIIRKPAHSGKTFGYHRAGILVALFNSTTLVLIALGIFYEAWRRFILVPEVKSDILIIVGTVAVVVNLVTALLVKKGSEKDLNLRSAFVHLLGDVLATIGAVVAGIIIRFAHWNWMDPLISVLIGLMILWNARGIIKESLEILMESSPSDVDMESLRKSILALEGVKGVHDLHAWSITRAMRTLSAHVITDDISISKGAQIQEAIGRMLTRDFGISHATLQLECIDCTQVIGCCEYSSSG